jgi:hypothetical protein
MFKKSAAILIMAAGLSACGQQIAAQPKAPKLEDSFSVIDTKDGYVRIRKDEFEKLMGIFKDYIQANHDYEIILKQYQIALDGVRCS